MESDIIKISHLNKSFSEVKAVNDLSFRVKKGELFAFLGVNGAGKSTTISILCGLQKKDSGTVQVNGIETDCCHCHWRSCFCTYSFPVAGHPADAWCNLTADGRL